MEGRESVPRSLPDIQPVQSLEEDNGGAEALENETPKHATSSLQRFVDEQRQIIDNQAAMIKTLCQELAHRKEEIAKVNSIKEELERLVLLAEKAEEEANEQVVSLEQEVVRLTELLQTHGIESVVL